MRLFRYKNIYSATIYDKLILCMENIFLIFRVKTVFFVFQNLNLEYFLVKFSYNRSLFQFTECGPGIEYHACNWDCRRYWICVGGAPISMLCPYKSYWVQEVESCQRGSPPEGPNCVILKNDLIEIWK